MATVARLARVNAAISFWDEYEANGLLPPEQRRALERPKLTRGGLQELQLMLGARIGELEERFGGPDSSRWPGRCGA